MATKMLSLADDRGRLQSAGGRKTLGGIVMGCAAMQLLEAELKTYEDHRLELLKSDEGKWVLVHKGRLVAVFDTQADAIRAGYKEFGNVPFLVKQVVTVEVPQNFVSNHLAL